MHLGCSCSSIGILYGRLKNSYGGKTPPAPHPLVATENDLASTASAGSSLGRSRRQNHILHAHLPVALRTSSKQLQKVRSIPMRVYRSHLAAALAAQG